jgi:type 1 fimbria pilin
VVQCWLERSFTYNEAGKMKLRVIVLGSVLLAATVAALTQSFTATLTGTVTDPSNKFVFGTPDTNLNSSQLGKDHGAVDVLKEEKCPRPPGRSTTS